MDLWGTPKGSPMRPIVVVGVFAAAIGCASAAVPAWAASNPSGTGPPNQSCQDVEKLGGTTPGHASSSPGSPFNEPSINSPSGGTGGQHYSENLSTTWPVTRCPSTGSDYW